jgi:hypothetical protein
LSHEFYKSYNRRRATFPFSIPLEQQDQQIKKSNMESTAAGSSALLARQLMEMKSSNDIPGISCGLVDDSNVYEWEVMLMINDDCRFYGGTASVSAKILSKALLEHAFLFCIFMVPFR